MSDSLGGKIKKARKNKGFTLEGLGQRIGWSHSLLSRIERDKHTPEDATLLALGKELNNDFDLEWLKKSLSFKPKLSVEEIVELVNGWIENNEVSLDYFIVALAQKNEIFSRVINDEKLKSATERVANFNKIFYGWDDDNEYKRKEMYDYINSNPELVKQLIQSKEKFKTFGQEIAPTSKKQATIKIEKEKKSQKKAS